MTARVLVVDDVELNVKLLEAKLSSEYFDVLRAYNGAAALEIAGSLSPDVILLDVMMPRMDGFEVCRRLKADPRTADLPVVMVTALSDLADRLHGLEVGADDFLTKPVNDTELFARVRSLVRLKRMTEELRVRDAICGRFGSRVAEADAEPCPGRILVIEENVFDAVRMVETLKPLARNVSSAGTHAEARAKLDAETELVIASLSVPDGDTLRLLSQFRAEEAQRQLPVLLVADTPDLTRLAKGLDLGANDYLVRPVDRSELVARARTQLRRKRLHDRLRENQLKSLALALTDELTGLYNRRYATAHLQEVMSRAAQGGSAAAVLLVDVDNFKRVNDTLGHAVGDQVLREIAARVTRNLRTFDLVARWGGDELIVIMPETDLGTAAAVAERLRMMVADRPFPLAGSSKGLDLTISVGVTTTVDEDFAKLLDRADGALYAAKHAGRNRLALCPWEEKSAAAVS
ncbi:MAG TPA: PleD family two-component system response regulator [Stellaceae bacterium]|nr:PleD family two-component system response regulator [Stellaceae bacterium]